MKRLLCMLAVLLTAAVSAFAQGTSQQQAQPPKTEQKPDQKTPPSIVGKWTIYLDPSSESGTFNFKLDVKKLTGTVTTPDGREMPLEGEFTDGKLNFVVTADTPNGPMQVKVGGTLKDDGTLSGTMEFGEGPRTWKGERAK